MKITLDLPDDLMRAVKIRAAEEGRKMKDVVAEFLRRGLAKQETNTGKSAAARVQLPLIKATGEATFDPTAERIDELEMSSPGFAP